MKLAPWFPASTPPVNGSPYSQYMWRCKVNGVRPRLATKRLLRNNTCAYCEWRGVLKEEK